jgi:hypothetical protein
MTTPTPFIEANALLALDDGAPDYDDARSHLVELSIGELYALERQAKRLYEFCRVIANEKRDEIEDDPRPGGAS